MPKEFVIKLATRNEKGCERHLSATDVALEFMAYQIYGLFCQIPKIYIVKDGEHYGIASRFLPGFLTLREYLGLEKGNMMEISDEKRQCYDEKIKDINGLLGLVAGATLLKDWDCIGINSSNIGVIADSSGQPTFVKIDPGKASFYEKVATAHDNRQVTVWQAETVGEFSVFLASADHLFQNATRKVSSSPDDNCQQLLCDDDIDATTSATDPMSIDETEEAITPQILMVFNSPFTCPNARFVFKHLSPQDKHDIIHMLTEIGPKQLHAIIFDPRLDELISDSERQCCFDTLMNRISALQSHYQEAIDHNQSFPKPSIPTQHTVVRPLTDFTRTTTKIYDGCAQPHVFFKKTKADIQSDRDLNDFVIMQP